MRDNSRCTRQVTDPGTQRAKQCSRKAARFEHGNPTCTQHSVAASLERQAKREAKVREDWTPKGDRLAAQADEDLSQEQQYWQDLLDEHDAWVDARDAAEKEMA